MYILFFKNHIVNTVHVGLSVHDSVVHHIMEDCVQVSNKWRIEWSSCLYAALEWLDD